MTTRTQRAVKAAGGNRAVATKLGVDPATIWRWSKDDSFPADHVKVLCDMTDGLIKPEQVRPDLADVFIGK